MCEVCFNRAFVCADAEQQPSQAVQDCEETFISKDMASVLGAIADDAASGSRADTPAAAIPGLVDSDLVTDMGGWGDWEDFLESDMAPEQQDAEADGDFDGSAASSPEVRTATSACETYTRCFFGKCLSRRRCQEATDVDHVQRILVEDELKT